MPVTGAKVYIIHGGQSWLRAPRCRLRGCLKGPSVTGWPHGGRQGPGVGQPVPLNALGSTQTTARVNSQNPTPGLATSNPISKRGDSHRKKSEKNQDANASRSQPTNCCQDGALRQIGVARECLIPSHTRFHRVHCDQPLWATSCPSLEQPSFQLESEKEAPLVSVRELEVEPQR